jgi:hypothetical protein
MPYNIQNDFLDPADRVIGENSIKEITITKENLDRLWNALEYTRATISPGNHFPSKQNPDWVEIHKGRAHQSNAYLEQAINIVNQLKKELN